MLITTLLIYPLRPIAPVVSTGVVYLLAVLLVSTYWGLGLGLVTALASAASFNFFHIHPTGWFTIADPQNWVALAVYLLAARSHRPLLIWPAVGRPTPSGVARRPISPPMPRAPSSVARA